MKRLTEVKEQLEENISRYERQIEGLDKYDRKRMRKERSIREMTINLAIVDDFIANPRKSGVVMMMAASTKDVIAKYAIPISEIERL